MPIIMDTDIDIILNELSPGNKELMTHARARLEELINHLLNNDFEKLINILYRIDVSESKLKKLLKENPGINASSIIAGMIIERQLQKIRSRGQFTQPKNHDDKDENEKW
jgi:hypothetical protein